MKNQKIIVGLVSVLVVLSVLFLGGVEYWQKTEKGNQGWWSVGFVNSYDLTNFEFEIENFEKDKEFIYEIVAEDKILKTEKVLVKSQEKKAIDPKIKNSEPKLVEIKVYSANEKSDKKSLFRK
jgi:hypothetical protein